MVLKKVVSNELAFSISSEVASAAAAIHIYLSLSSHSPQRANDYRIRKIVLSTRARAHVQYNIQMNWIESYSCLHALLNGIVIYDWIIVE